LTKEGVEDTIQMAEKFKEADGLYKVNL